MKILILVTLSFILSVPICLSADGSLQIPPERQEAISRQMIALQLKQLAAANAISDAKEKIAQAQADEEKYLAMVDALRKEFNVESCPGRPDVKPDLSLDKKWICPPVAKTAK